MVRYLATAAGILILVSGVALAQTEDYGSKTITIQQTPYGKTVTKRHLAPSGEMVTKHKMIREGFYGGSVSRRSLAEPYYGDTITRPHRVIER